MADGTTTYGAINQRTAAWAATEALSHAEPVLILGRFGQMKPLPPNKANTVKFRRPIPFTAATTPLVEGVTPVAQKMAYEDVTAVIKQYGKPIEITDVVQDLVEDPVLKDAMMLVGEQAAATIEQIIYGVVKAGTNVFRANGSLRTDINTPITLNKQRQVTRNLKANKAKMITQMLDSSPKFGTFPIEAAYIAACHTDCEADIRNMSGFIPVAEYGTRQPIAPEEIGSCESVRYIGSPDLAPFTDAGAAKAGSGVTMLSTTGTSADVYPIIFFGKEAYGQIPLKGKGAITPIVIPIDKPDKADPMGQRGYVSWKTYFAAVRLNELWMARLECSATDLS